jgi:hypothetical protein
VIGGVALWRGRRRRERRIAGAIDRAVADAVGPRPPAFTGSYEPTIRRRLQPEDTRP